MEIGKEGEGRATGRGSTARGGARKPIGEGESGYEVRRQEQVKKKKTKEQDGRRKGTGGDEM